MTTPTEVLEAAADLLEKPGAWTTGVFARDAAGHQVGLRDDRATCFCLAGAIEKAAQNGTFAFREAFDIMDAMARRAGFRHVAAWNDAPGRTQAEVVATLRQASRRGGEA